MELSKTHVIDDFLGYLEHKTLNMYGSIFQKDPPLANHFFNHVCLYKGVSCYSCRSTIVMVVLMLVVVAVVIVVVLEIVMAVVGWWW